MKKYAAAISVTIILLLLLGAFYSESTQGALAQNILRLHILANSNSEADQALKIKVRDRLLEESRGIFDGCESIAETRALAGAHLERLTAAAKDEIQKNGFDYDVKIDLGRYDFPTKRYGNIALPAGEYEAVRVTIGKGEGENWWCVMFPPLCFVGSVEGTAGAKELDALKEKLDKNEYDILTESNGKVPVKIKFKVVEIFQNSIQTIKAAAK